MKGIDFDQFDAPDKKKHCEITDLHGLEILCRQRDQLVSIDCLGFPCFDLLGRQLLHACSVVPVTMGGFKVVAAT